MAQQSISVGMDIDVAASYMDVDLALTVLPPLRPKPPLTCRYRQRRTQFKDAVLAFGDLDLGAGLIEMQPATNFGRQGYDPPRLDSHIPAIAHAIRIAVIPEMRITLLR